MSKHTPGPWSVYEDCNKVAAHGAKYPAIGTMGTYFTESITDSLGEFYNSADARLVAAAPDLLNALIQMVNTFGKTDGLVNVDSNGCIGKARLAIAKATGGSD